MEDNVSKVCKDLRKALECRDRFIAASMQLVNPKNTWTMREIELNGLPPDSKPISMEPWGSEYKMTPSGIFSCTAEPDPHIPTVSEYYAQFELLSQLSFDGPAKTWSFRRLRLLSARFQMHLLQNEQTERDAQKRVPHRDFYNVRKIDTHVHHSAAMNCKHLLRFIKYKLKKAGTDVVCHRDGQTMTLEQVFKSLHLSAYDLSIDSLDTHAHKDSFHRFDRFNFKYNPLGESRLREIFLKTDNMINGRYLAELTKELFDDLKVSKYQMAEYRLSIYGHKENEWTKLASWVIDNHLYSDNVRWMIQIPRLYNKYQKNKMVASFEHFLNNIFEPLFRVTEDPNTDPKLHHFLKRLSGFDTVDDESRRERRLYDHVPSPREWTGEANPPYSYYLYYFYANIAALNRFRAERGQNTFTLRPHSGEAGDPDHLISAYLTSQGISHGILLRKLPVIQYLYYLAKIPISVSPLSNNSLFLPFERNPFPDFFQRGLMVTLSTDDPLQFHYTREPLMEEYSVAAQIWKLSSCDMCEIARNSVLGSGWEGALKKRWVSKSHTIIHAEDGSSDQCTSSSSSLADASSTLSFTFDNDIEKSNVPDLRIHYRQQCHLYEMAIVYSHDGASPPTNILSPLILVQPRNTVITPVDGEELLLKEEEEFVEDLQDYLSLSRRCTPSPASFGSTPDRA